MESAQNGEREAFHLLFAEIGPLVTRFVRRRVLDHSEVEDICQEALIAVFKSRHTYQPKRPFEPWLFAIVRRVSAEYIRRKRRQTAAHELMGEVPELRTEDSTSLMLEFEDACERLSADQIESLELTKLAGFSIGEAARQTGASVASMKVRVHRAYLSLKRSMLR